MSEELNTEAVHDIDPCVVVKVVKEFDHEGITFPKDSFLYPKRIEERNIPIVELEDSNGKVVCLTVEQMIDNVLILKKDH